MGRTKTDAQATAFELYVHTEKTQKEIAVLVGVAEKTIGTWSAAGQWESVRLAKRTTTHAIVAQLEDILKNQLAKTADKAAKEGLAKADADIITQLTNSIDQMRQGVPIRYIVQVLEEFTDYIRSNCDKRITEEVIGQQTGFLARIKDRLNNVSKR
ncbi:Phage terminase small subunit [Flexibacter flexilis DSM 6793]|uniref:Phage terminase small subunit n=1 Tax=Flexibacter flexilis DSM 6793 TaxID=927664 RepID=A0A1I1E699_9BACT|nr:hypothetical protein [Flexibacter flexilis]SFB80423.1 Phage terminase small subunit [Flexibacter flexilis DSM 6793]